MAPAEPSLVDEIERLGSLAESGELSRTDAACQLQQFSDGGLTRLGAERAIDRWRTRRAEYTAIFAEARRQYLRLITGGAR